MKAVALLSFIILSSAVAFAPPRQTLHTPNAFALNAEDKPGFFGRVFGKASNGDSNTAVLEPEMTAEVKVAEDECDVPEKEEELNEVQKLFKQIKDSGLAGSISLFLWEGAFWAISIPVAIFGYSSVSGHLPDLSDKEDLAKVGAEAFAFANVARLALPVRIALAVSTTPWVQENIVDRFLKKEDECDPEEK